MQPKVLWVNKLYCVQHLFLFSALSCAVPVDSFSLRCTAVCRGPQVNAGRSFYQQFTSEISLSPGCHTSRVRPSLRGVPRQTTDDGRNAFWAVLVTSHGASPCGRPLHSPLAPSGHRDLDSWLIHRAAVLVGNRNISRENTGFIPILSFLT